MNEPINRYYYKVRIAIRPQTYSMSFVLKKGLLNAEGDQSEEIKRYHSKDDNTTYSGFVSATNSTVTIHFGQSATLHHCTGHLYAWSTLICKNKKAVRECLVVAAFVAGPHDLS